MLGFLCSFLFPLLFFFGYLVKDVLTLLGVLFLSLYALLRIVLVRDVKLCEGLLLFLEKLVVLLTKPLDFLLVLRGVALRLSLLLGLLKLLYVLLSLLYLLRHRSIDRGPQKLGTPDLHLEGARVHLVYQTLRGTIGLLLLLLDALLYARIHSRTDALRRLIDYRLETDNHIVNHLVGGEVEVILPVLDALRDTGGNVLANFLAHNLGR